MASEMRRYGLGLALLLLVATATALPQQLAGLNNQFSGRVVPTRTAVSDIQRPELDKWRNYEALRGDGLEGEKLRSFFAKRPQLVAARLAEVATTLSKAKSDWEKSAEGLAAGEKSDEFDPTKDVRDEAPEEGTRGARLCEAMSSLGPVSVKISQTLSQRPDLVGDEAATALKRLQTSNVPYEDELAWAVIKESLNWEGPIAPGVGVDEGMDPDSEPLFQSITPKPVAVASLGQVYKATLHDGRDVAVKVQRPDAMAILAKDYMCFVVSWGLLELSWKLSPGGFDNGDISSVITRVATDILDGNTYRIIALFSPFLFSLSLASFALVISRPLCRARLREGGPQRQALRGIPELLGLRRHSRPRPRVLYEEGPCD